MILTVAPWTRFWERNYLVEWGPLTEAVLTSGVIRGSITGLGLVSLCAVCIELWTVVRNRWVRSSTASQHGAPGSMPDVAARELPQEACPPSS